MTPLTVPLFGQWTATFDAERQPPPLTQLSVKLTSPTGRTLRIRGFWEGGRRWSARFMPTELGRWRYVITAEPAFAGLAREDEFEVVASADRHRFDRHGPIEVSPNGYHLRHADGTPFFYLADTAWNGPLLSSASDWEKYLDERVAKKFTAIQFITHAPWLGCYTNAGDETAFTGNDIAPINPHFFKRIDERLAAINARGLLAVPVLLWAAPSAGAVWSPGTMLPVDQLVEIARHQVARFGGNHVLWALPGDGIYTGFQAAKWRRVGRETFGDIDHAPVTFHPRGLHWPYDKFADEAWLTVAGYQSGHSTKDDTRYWLLTGPPAKAQKRSPAKPIINMEPCYEQLQVQWEGGHRLSDADVRWAAYTSLLNAPTAGVAYGAHGVWGWHLVEEEPVNHAFTGTGMPWHQALALPGSGQMAHLAKLFTSIEWWTLRPDPHLLALASTVEPRQRISAAWTADGRTAIFYIPAGGAMPVHEGMKGVECAVWFNPRTGSRTAGTAPYKSPNSEDWVLLVRK